MSDLNYAVQKAVYDKLNVAAVTNIAPVYQHVPDDAQPPFVIIGEIIAEPAGGKGGGLDQVTIEIVSLRREPRRAALYELMAAVRDQLEGEQITAAGAVLSPPVFEVSDDDLLDDGVTYAGTQRFSLYAQSA